MFLKILLNFINGYINIKVESYYIERFINICISKKIFLWNIKRKKSCILYANIGIRDYKKLRSIARKTNSIIKIENKKGLPFLIYKYKKRKILFSLFISFILIIFIISNYIWNIDIEGNEQISKEVLLDELKNDGLKTGMKKSKIDVNSIVNKVRLRRDDISWIGIKLKGTNAVVEIKETQKAPTIIDINEYCNIVSDKQGIITKIDVQNGTANVNVGDTVKPGDTIVLGQMEGKYTGIRYVHAIANIEAKTWYSKKEKFYFKQNVKEPTNATEKKYSIKFNNFEINLYKTLSKFQNYDTICINKKIKIFSNIYLPIEIIKKTNYEYKNEEKIYTEEELKDIGTKKLEQELDKELENRNNIINKYINTYGNTEYIEIEVIYEMLENIGIEEKILF